MMTLNVPPPAATSEPIMRVASQLVPGDRIAAGFLPNGDSAEVLFTTPYRLGERDSWVLVVSRFADGAADSDHFLADAQIPLEGLADFTGLTYSREADDPRPVSPARGVVSSSAYVVEGQIVPIEEPSVTAYFSFGHGQTDPDTGENLLDKYVTIVGPTYAACREAMFASKYGQAWAFDYLAGTPTADEWIPQWTEHDRIVLSAT